MSDELAERMDFEQDDFFFEEETEAQAYERMSPAEQEADRLYAEDQEREADAEQSREEWHEELHSQYQRDAL